MISARQTQQMKHATGRQVSAQWCVSSLTSEKRLDHGYTALPTSIQFANPEGTKAA